METAVTPTAPQSDIILQETGDDFVDLFQITARWTDVGVEHTRRRTDRRRGIRNAVTVERWERKQEVGRSGFGTVHLEKREDGQLRAIKMVPKVAGRARTLDHLREILAMAYFTRVGLANAFRIQVGCQIRARLRVLEFVFMVVQ